MLFVGGVLVICKAACFIFLDTFAFLFLFSFHCQLCDLEVVYIWTLNLWE